ncbi:MAG: inositol 2-dehydrogenase [Hyphomicrobiales bacterium]|nr:inositol 2-dehydrogenase [Hyphomicrobiales bacterium]
MSKRFAILGAGRIGQVHARAVSNNEDAELAAIFDPADAAAESIVERYGAARMDIEEIAADAGIDAVLLCTPTDRHAEQIEFFARAGKAVFCEKPIDLSSSRARECLDTVEKTKATLMVGFNRRYDPHFMAVKAQIDNGSIGNPETGVIISRDPALPPAEYIKRSGGIFKDMMIHDFDMAVYLMGSVPETVSATGSVLTDPEVAGLGDYDTACAVLRWTDGRQMMISNSRRAVYGYDQRIEVHGSQGMVAAENQRPVGIELATEKGYTRPPLHDFFMTRYTEAYANEINAFIEAINGGAVEIPTGKDGLNSLLMAEAALASLETGTVVKIA